MDSQSVFTDEFVHVLRSFVRIHHSIYPAIPPQGIFFESLVEEAFKRIRTPFLRVESTPRNLPKNDLIVGDVKISLKTETGASTKPDRINITKLCTTEREPWSADVLVRHVMEHLSRYDQILMLRAVWNLPIIHYQIVDIPVELLRKIKSVILVEVGRRPGRRSLGADICSEEGRVLFHVHFDGSDGKCQIRNLVLTECRLLHEWNQQISD